MIADNLSIPIELFISGRSLRDKDFFSKSDPFVKVSYRRDFNCKSYIELGRTETMQNNLNPNFTTTLALDYIFESRQDIKFEVFDDDGSNSDWIGTVETTVGALMGAKNQTSILDLHESGDAKKSTGKLIIRCQKQGNTNYFYDMQWKAKKLMNTDSFFDFWDKSDPYLRFLKIRDDNSLIQVHKTEWIKNDLNPAWKPVQIQCDRLHTENNPKFKVQCWDWEESGKDNFIGETFLDVSQLKMSNYPLEIPLSNPKSKKPGHIILQKFSAFHKPSFIDYLRGGLDLNMIIAIDFTASNGSPMQPSSLHYMDPNGPNQYQKAITAVAQILLNYDSDKRIPTFGFGGKIHFPKLPKQTSHCFPLSGDFDDVEAMGIQHLMELYQNSLKHMQLSGPTYFGSIIDQVAKRSAACKRNNNFAYQTLLILTDGEIHDMAAVKDLIVRSTELPLSIIIVGIGNANFGNMQQLDGDGGLFDSKGRRAPRDIVQFVPFREVQFNSDVLAKQLLAQLPNQIVQYFQMQGLQPRPPQQGPNMSEM